MNELATNLFKNLIDNGYKYLTNAANNKLIFTVNNTEFIIYSIKCNYKEKEPFTFDPTHLSLFSYWNIYSDKNCNNIIFRIQFNNEYFDVKLSRVEFAQYLDKVEAIVNRWYEDKMINTINFLDTELEELD